MNKSNEQIAMTAGRNSIIVNIGLSAFKLFAGIFAGSAAMVSDAVHSITDLFGTVIAMVGIKMANKKSDDKHPYGHERFESVATLALAALITVVGVGIGWSGIQTILAGDFEHLAIPGILALVAAAVSIAVKELLFRYVRSAARKIDSNALMADAWHSRVDGLSSIGSFVGILGARMGFPILDSVAALVICVFILKTAVGITIDAIGKMTDSACDYKTTEEMRNIILAQEEVMSVDTLRTRLFGNRIFVDVEIGVSAELSFRDAHNTAHRVHDAIEKQFPKVKHCKVHANPVEIN
ncbi:MAG: cation diffusion facilitator family transporter [Defluviitaleaceae bacterium]|nr:cation diffusion facilitator family transporter [Defluviitaleaceae bacterium]